MPHEDSSKRRDHIFDIIVRSYIKTAEPVASRAISKRFNLGLSPASIRNVMADLEDMGLLKQPHTSAGRIPTEKGYRYFVDRLIKPEVMTKDEKEWVVKELQKAKTIEGLADRVSKIISELTKNAALVYIKNLKRVSFLTYLLEELVEAERLNDFFEEEAELLFEGALRLFEQPEFHDATKMRVLLHAFQEKYIFLPILVKDLSEEGVHVHIGHETGLEDLEDISLVVKDWYLRGVPIGGVAVVGPTRMNYPKVISVVDFVADSVTNAVQRF